SATDKLYCVYSRSDEEGKAQSPSWYLRELCRAAGVPLEKGEHVPRQPLERLRGSAPETLNPQEIALRLIFAGEDASGYLDSVGVGGALLRDSAPRAALLNGTGKAGPLDGLVGPLPELAAKLASEGLSPSRLDDF